MNLRFTIYDLRVRRPYFRSSQGQCGSHREEALTLFPLPPVPSRATRLCRESFDRPCLKARRADIFVENRTQTNNKLRQELNSLLIGRPGISPAQKMSLLTELGKSFSGCFYKYAAPNGADAGNHLTRVNRK